MSDTPAYQVLARKYRPARFADLIGQDAMVRTLKNAFEADRIAQAFIMTGIRGTGKTTTARILAKGFNCVGPDGAGGPTTKPCGVCEFCTAISESRHVDVLEMDAASRTGVDDIREIIDSVAYRAASARYKIYIIDEVHMLSKNAFNALLKTLEEPPEHVKFIFATTEINKVPETVLSRCQRFDQRRIEPETMIAHLTDIAGKETAAIAEDALALIARAAEGSVRVAGLEIRGARARDILALRRETLGYVSQFLRVVPRVPTVDVVAVDTVFLMLLPLLETDGPSLQARFGPKLGKRIGRLVADANAEYEEILAEHFTGISIEGSVASQSGTYREPIKIQARPARDAPFGPDRPTRTGVATVDWDDQGRGTFHIQNLDTGRYELRMLGSSVPLPRPAHVVVASPSDQRGRPLFTILDEQQTSPVAIRAQTADGTWLGGFRAKIEAPFGGRVLRGGVVAPLVFDTKRMPPSTIVLSEVPEGSRFEVKVSLAGFKTATLHWNDFSVEGKRLVATAVLFGGENSIGSGR